MTSQSCCHRWDLPFLTFVGFSRYCAQVLHEVTFLASPGREIKTG